MFVAKICPGDKEQGMKATDSPRQIDAVEPRSRRANAADNALNSGVPPYLETRPETPGNSRNVHRDPSS